MRTILILSLFAVGSSLLTPPRAQAQPARPDKRLQLETIRIGYPVGLQKGQLRDGRNRPSYYRVGYWCPVYVEVKNPLDGDPVDNAKLYIECADGDDIQTRYPVEIRRRMAPDSNEILMTYVKPGKSDGKFKIILEANNYTVEKEVDTVAGSLLGNETMFLCIGSKMQVLRDALYDIAKRNDQPDSGEPIVLQMCGVIDDVTRLPRRWFGYDSVDTLFLSTNNAGFVRDLLNEQEGRKEALGEWVRRGGKLVVSSDGVNSQELNKILEGMGIISLIEDGPAGLPVIFGGSVDNVERLTSLDLFAANDRNPYAAAEGKKLLVARFLFERTSGGRDYEILVPEGRGGQSSDPPTVVRAPCGLGQVVLVGLDLESRSFDAWDGRTTFFKKLLQETGTVFPTADETQRQPGVYYHSQTRELASQLDHHMEAFNDVSNISFGWVALFIFIYILIVGPLDYFFLKKVVKRLELTWITFPTVVIVISAVAYFSAYALKGEALLINKVDVIDVDVSGKQVYGTTWFTLFSPRIQSYTIGIEPATGSWTAPLAEDKKPSTGVVVSWMARSSDLDRWSGRSQAPTWFRGRYDFEEDAMGLRGVPIQVWSTKSFTANWVRPMAETPPVAGELFHPDERTSDVSGRIRNNLPVDLDNVVLIHGDRSDRIYVYSLGRINSSDSKVVSAGSNRENVKELANWFERKATPAEFHGKERVMSGAIPAMDGIMQEILFFSRAPDRRLVGNQYLESLDEGWRLRLKDEAVLFAQLPHMDAASETVTKSEGNPTNLWLGELPNSGRPRPTLSGKINQKTFVRAYLPIRPAEGK